MIRIILTLLLFSFSAQASPQFKCGDAYRYRDTLFTMTANDFTPGNPKYVAVRGYLTSIYLTAQSIKTDEQSGFFMKQMGECLKSAPKSTIPFKPSQTCVAPYEYKDVSTKMNEQARAIEAQSLTDRLVEIACSGTAAIELYRWGVAAARRVGVVSPGVFTRAGAIRTGWATLAVTSAMIGGYLGGVTTLRVDEIFGSPVAGARDAAADYVFQQIVNWWYGHPSQKDLNRLAAEQRAAMFLRTFAQQRFFTRDVDVCSVKGGK